MLELIVMHLLPQRLPGINKSACLDKDRQLVIEALDRLLQLESLAEGELLGVGICAIEPDQRESLRQKNHGQVEILCPEVALVIAAEHRRKFVHESHLNLLSVI